MDLNEVAVFIQVVQSGSFTQAAKKLDMPNSTVSFKVQALEKRLGVSLIQRTTRKLHITPAGQEFYNSCLIGLEGIRAAEEVIMAAKGEPQGLLKITAPVELGSTILPSIVSSFTKKFPKTTIEIILADRKVDLLGEGVDLAIRAGELKDSTLIAKRLGAVYFAMFASPKYLKAFGTPKKLDDLKTHVGIGFTPFAHGMKLTSGKAAGQLVNLPKRIIINDLNMVKSLAAQGEGIALLPTFLCNAEVQASKLIRLLPEWTTEMQPVHFVYPAQKFVLPKLSAFIAHAGDILKESLRI